MDELDQAQNKNLEEQKNPYEDIRKNLKAPSKKET